MFGLGVSELLVIGLIVVFLFGAKKIPHLGGSLAKGIKNFQKGMKEGDKALDQEENDKENQNSDGDENKKDV